MESIKKFVTAKLFPLRKSAYLHFIFFGLVMVFLNVLNNADLIKSSVINELSIVMIYGIATLGFSILLGYGGLASLGTAVFIAIGAFFTRFFMNNGVPAITTLLLVTVIGCVLGIIVGFLSLRISGMYLAIITLVIGEILIELFKTSALTPFSGGTGSAKIALHRLFFTIPLSNEVVYYMIIVVMVILLVFVHNFRKGPAGRAMLSMKNSESAAQTMGVNLLKYRILAFVISTAFSSIAGYFYILYMRSATISTFNLNTSLNILAAVVVGGTGSLWGLLTGVFLVFGTKGIVFQNIPFLAQNPDFMLFVNGALVIIVVLFYPGGVSQLIRQVQFKLAIWKAKRAEKNKTLKEQGESSNG